VTRGVTREGTEQTELSDCAVYKINTGDGNPRGPEWGSGRVLAFADDDNGPSDPARHYCPLD
jgi:hypothetical protein